MSIADEEDSQPRMPDSHPTSAGVPAFRVEWRDNETSRSVWAFGEADLVAAGSLREALECHHRSLEVDLSGVTFMDLAALNVLIEAAARHDEVSLVTSPRVDRLLDLTETRYLFEME